MERMGSADEQISGIVWRSFSASRLRPGTAPPCRDTLDALELGGGRDTGLGSGKARNRGMHDLNPAARHAV